MKPLVSILIPAYNSGKWIAETLNSATGQTWPQKEIIVVDDGSRDDTLAVARQFEAENVKVLTQENGGASAARNHAFSVCQGEYIQWLDADDVLELDKIECQMDVALQEADPRILYSGEWAFFFHQVENAKFDSSPLWEDLEAVEFLRRKMGQNLHMQPDCWLVSREATEAAGPWDETLWRDNDGEYFCRVLLAVDKVRFVPGAKSYYRRSGSTSISYIGTSQKKIESLYRSITLHVGYLRLLDDSDISHAACLNYLGTWLPYFFPERMDLVDQLRAVANEMGGELKDPVMSRQYRLIRQLLGWSAAKAAQRTVSNWRQSVSRFADRLFARGGPRSLVL